MATVGDIPRLVRLRYGEPYCEGCGDTLAPGMLVAWWPVAAGRETRSTVYCSDCHRARVEVVCGKRRGARSRGRRL